MIRLPPAECRLSPREHYALGVLVDLARLVPVEDPAADVVSIAVVGPDDGVAPAVGDSLAFRPGEGQIEIPRSTLRWVTDVTGAGAEQRSGARDRYSRVPAAANPLVAAGAERQPRVAHVAAALRRAVIAAAGRRPIRLVAPWPEGRRWAVAFTHDLDVVAWWPLATTHRLLELARAAPVRHARRIGRVAGAAVASVGRDPVMAGIAEIAAIERRLGITSTWFILCGQPTLATLRAGDLTYSPTTPALQRILQLLRAGGHEVALHGSFATCESAERFLQERRCLEALTDAPVVGVRQHYLRMHPGATQRAMASGGFRYDATFGFSDRSGFRLGVSDIVPAWDEERGQGVDLQIVPLVWMDRSASKYRGVEEPMEWVRDALETATASRSVEGLWTALWHPNSTAALGFPGAPEAYGALAEAIMTQEPYVASVAALTQWRLSRRSVRVRRLLPGGSVEAWYTGAAAEPIPLLDAQGRVQETLGPVAP